MKNHAGQYGLLSIQCKMGFRKGKGGRGEEGQSNECLSSLQTESNNM